MGTLGEDIDLLTQMTMENAVATAMHIDACNGLGRSGHQCVLTSRALAAPLVKKGSCRSDAFQFLRDLRDILRADLLLHTKYEFQVQDDGTTPDGEMVTGFRLIMCRRYVAKPEKVKTTSGLARLPVFRRAGSLRLAAH